MRKTWLFQANPQTFDIDGYLATSLGAISWYVSRYADRMSVGDEVYIWRSDGDGQGGVIAECVITEEPVERLDDASALPFWRDRQKASEKTTRARLDLIRVATKREVIRRQWIKEDPLLRDLPVIKMSNATNYEVSVEHASRLRTLWTNTGRDWTYAESVAGLWAYLKTSGGKVSQLPGSPVAEVSLLIGRAIGGVYNKVMNFRSLDPRDQRTGMSGSGATDQSVWTKFFDPSMQQIRSPELGAEFERLWKPQSLLNTLEGDRAYDRSVEDAAGRLEALDLGQLMARYRRRKPHTAPNSKASTARTFERDPLVIAISKKRANHRCEVPGCRQSTFITSAGITYCEVHHIEMLADGGPDTVENVACLCPTHHREAHIGRRRDEIRTELKKLRSPEATARLEGPG